MDPMGGQPAYAPAGHQVGGDGSGACSACGRPLPPPDLEAVAAGIDQTLSMEAGRMVERTAWAGRAPDGMMDSLLSFMASVKQKRQLWERGQALWTERMTQAISGPCDSCRGVSSLPSASMAAGPPQTPAPYSTGAATPSYGQPEPYGQPDSYGQSDPALGAVQPAAPPPTSALPYTGATSMMPGYDRSAIDGSDDEYESKTSMMAPMTPTFPIGAPAGQQPSGAPAPDEDDPDSVTTALPAFLNQAAEAPVSIPQPIQPPAAAAPLPSAQAISPQPAPPPSFLDTPDEHESHTVMMSAPANLRTGPRLIVLEGPVHGRQFGLGRQLTTIGRSIGCHVTVESDAVGYDHARVVRSEDGWRIESISGSGDTYVNDDLVRGVHPLNSGDVIRVGPARIRFESVG